MPGVHSNLGASALDRWGNCPGSVTLIEKVPAEFRNKSSVYADEGSCAHQLCERHVAAKWIPGKEGMMPLSLDKLIGYYIDMEGALFPATHNLEKHELPFFEITEEMASAADIYEQTIGKELRALGYGADKPQVKLGLEIQFNLAYIDKEMFGTCDCAVFSPGEVLHIIDFKYGAGKVVEVDDNPQLMYYALGAIRHFCWDDAFGEYVNLPKKVVLHIVQPRARHKKGPVRMWETTAEYLIKDFGLDLMSKVNAARKPDADLAVGDWCRWCAAKAHCPAQLAKVKTILQADFADLEIEARKPRDVEIEAKQRAKGLMPTTADEVAEVMKCLPIIEEFCKAIAARAQTDLEAGISIPGQKLVQKRAFRKYLDERAAALALEQYLDKDQIYDAPKLKSPNVIEGLLPSKRADNGKGAHKLLESLTLKESSGLTIAPEYDPRDAVIPEVQKAAMDYMADDGIIL